MRGVGLGDRQWQRKACVRRLKSAGLHMQRDRRNAHDIFSSRLTRITWLSRMRGGLAREAGGVVATEQSAVRATRDRRRLLTQQAEICGAALEPPTLRCTQ